MENYRVGELVTQYKRMMQAKFLEGDANTLQIANDFLQSIGQGGQ
jgi:hypothetical protein